MTKILKKGALWIYATNAPFFNILAIATERTGMVLSQIAMFILQVLIRSARSSLPGSYERKSGNGA